MTLALVGLVLVCPNFSAYPGLALGDSRTSDRGDGETNWVAQVTELPMLNAGQGGQVWSQCFPARASSPHGIEVAQCGVNDIIDLADDGHTVWAAERAWAEGRVAAGRTVYVMNMPGFKGMYPTQSLLDARNAFNSDFAAYCVAPPAGIKCIDIATPLQDPADHDKLLAAYTLDGIHYTTAGHTVVKQAFEAVYP